jgi:hypothetical protein
MISALTRDLGASIAVLAVFAFPPILHTALILALCPLGLHPCSDTLRDYRRCKNAAPSQHGCDNSGGCHV